MHIHTDIIAGLFALGFVVLGLHTMRMAGAYIGSHGMPGAGKVLGGLATFN